MNIDIKDRHFSITVATAIAAIIFIIATTITIATWKADMNAQHKEFDDRITHIGDKVVSIRDDIECLQLKANDRDIQLATINTKLANIETLLIEIKQDLKSKT